MTVCECGKPPISLFISSFCVAASSAEVGEGHGHATIEDALALISVVEGKAPCSEKVKCLNSNNLYPMTVIYNKLRIFVNAMYHSLKEIVAVLHDGSVVVLRILFSFH